MKDIYETIRTRSLITKQEFGKAIRTLEGILAGIAIDHHIDTKEADELKNWVSEYKQYENDHPFNVIIASINEALKDGFLKHEGIRDILGLCRQYNSDKIYSLINADTHRLNGILHGIMSDSEIKIEEIIGLGQWLKDNQHLSRTYPYDEIFSLVTAVLADEILKEEEKILLKAFFSDFLVNSGFTIKIDDLDKLKQNISIGGICAYKPNIRIKNKLFCFTGNSSRTNKKEISELIESLGGFHKGMVTNITNYLIVGDEGTPGWSYSCYGRKVEAAVELRKAGNKIQIIHESDFWEAVDELS